MGHLASGGAGLLTQWLKKSIAVLDAANPAIKQGAVLAMSFLLAGVVKFAGGYLPSGCSTADAVVCASAIADPQAMQVMLSALFAYVLHASQKQASA
jgi:hypothetical protein